MSASERRAQLKDALLRAAERAIETHGLEGVRARDLAREAGCAVGAIYNVFEDLDSLVLQVNLRTLASLEAFLAQTAGREVEDDAGDTEAALGDLVRLSADYLAFAHAHPRRWRALFQHRMSEGRPVPDWYLDEQVRLFRYVERALRVIQPRLGDAERTLFARSLFSAVHGVVSLGLDEKLGAMPLDVLSGQVECVVSAMGRGLLAARPSAG
jgi:AcrR family transcriptional regulator